MSIIEVIKSLFYGIIEGITEWLPVSSTGHLILFEKFFPFNLNDEFMQMFRVVIQLGAIMAVVVIFFWNIWPFAINRTGKHSAGYIKKPKDKVFLKNFVFKWDTFLLLINILVACIPAIIYALTLDDKMEALMTATVPGTNIKYEFLVVLIMLIVVGVFFIIIENRNTRTATIERVDDITAKTAFIIGIFQLVAAILPGTSRSGATIIGALFIGVSRAAATEFTFYLAIPAMFGASLYKGFKFLMTGISFGSTELAVLIVGMISAFIVSIFAIKFLMEYVKKHDFKPFGIYRIAVGVLLLILVFAKVI